MQPEGLKPLLMPRVSENRDVVGRDVDVVAKVQEALDEIPHLRRQVDDDEAIRGAKIDPFLAVMWSSLQCGG